MKFLFDYRANFITVILSIANAMDIEISQTDVTPEIFHGILDEEI